MKIWYFTPYSLTKNLGQEYNEYMRLIPEGDSACFTDGDVMFLTPDFGTIIHSYATAYPDAVLTCRTNRIHHLSKQLAASSEKDNSDVLWNIKKAEMLKLQKTVTEIKPGEAFSGFLMIVPKKIWEQVPFSENLRLLGVDSQFRIDLHKAGVKTYIMDGLFVWHTYRLLTNVFDKSHLV